MSTSDETAMSSFSTFIPLLLVELSVILGLIWQCNFISEQRKLLHANEQQIDATATTVTPQQEEQVRNSQIVQEKLKEFAEELLKISAGDPEAKAIVDKYGIRQNPPNAN